MFFDKYITNVGVDLRSTFIFVMKKLYNFDESLKSIVKLYSCIDIHLLLLPDQYVNSVIDKNKDDFVCQYLFVLYKRAPNKYDKIHLISNDKYRDKMNYINLFNFQLNVILFNSHFIHKMEINLDKDTRDMIKDNIRTTSIPKYQLANMI